MWKDSIPTNRTGWHLGKQAQAGDGHNQIRRWDCSMMGSELLGPSQSKQELTQNTRLVPSSPAGGNGAHISLSVLVLSSSELDGNELTN